MSRRRSKETPRTLVERFLGGDEPEQTPLEVVKWRRRNVSGPGGSFRDSAGRGQKVGVQRQQSYVTAHTKRFEKMPRSIPKTKHKKNATVVRCPFVDLAVLGRSAVLWFR